MHYDETKTNSSLFKQKEVLLNYKYSANTVSNGMSYLKNNYSCLE